MKIYIIVAMSIFALCCSNKIITKENLLANSKLNDKLKIDSLFQVSKIDSINSFYIIYLKKNDQNFKIVSKKVNYNMCDKIKTGLIYSFKIRSILDTKIKLGDHEFPSSSNALVNCFTFEENTTICKEKGINDLYQATNLDGLCLNDK